MIKEALQYIVSLSKAETQYINGDVYSDKPLHRIDIYFPTAEPIRVNNLSSLLEYIHSGVDAMADKMIIQVVSPTKVVLFSQLNDNRERETLVIADAQIPSFNYERFIEHELDEKNIYRFGMGFNSAQIGDGNITNIVIKSRYALLDLKCNKIEIRLKQFMRKLLKVVLEEINEQKGTDYQQKDVYFNFEREVMTNAADNAQIELTDAQKQQTQITTLLNIASYLDNETLMQNMCDVLDIDYEEIKDKLPTPEDDPTAAAQAALGGIQPEGNGDVVE